MFEISTANPKEYTLLFNSNNLFILIIKYLASLEKTFQKIFLLVQLASCEVRKSLKQLVQLHGVR